MPDMQTELSKVINGWENGASSAMGVSQTTFHYIKENPGCTSKSAVEALEKMGLKPTSTVSLISAMVRQNHVRKDANRKLYAIASAYVPIKQNSAKKTKPKAVKPSPAPAPAPAPEAQGIAALYVPPKAFDAAALIDSLTLRQALELRALLNEVWRNNV